MAQDVALLTQWKERLKRQEESGMTIEAFCEKEGVSTSMFYRWRRHLQDSTAEPAATEQANVAKQAGKKRDGGGGGGGRRVKSGRKKPYQPAKRRTGNLRSFCNCPCEACGRCPGLS